MGYRTVDPRLVEAMDRRRPGDRHVAATFVPRDDLRPSPPWSQEQFRRFRRWVEDLIGELDETLEVSPSDHDVWIDAGRGAVAVHGRVSFIEALLQRPEIALAFNDFVLSTIPARDAKTVA